MKILGPLNTPAKRVGAIVLAVAIVWLVVGMVYSTLGYSYTFGTSRTEAAFRNLRAAFDLGSYYFDEYWYIRWAGIIAAAGLIASYAYDFTVGPVLSWVRGSTGNNPG
jgi:hypothetical protein